jgi:hypothetical protein
VARISWERLAAITGVAYVVLYVAAFGLGIEVGPTDAEIREHYADRASRTKEAIAFFLIAGAALALLLFSTAIRKLIDRVDAGSSLLSTLAWTGGVASATLALAGNAVSRAPAFASMSDEFELDPNTRRLTEDAGLLLFASGAIAAILLVAALSLASLRYRLLPHWLAWSGFVAAVLLPLAVGFVGFLVFFAWLLAVAIALAFRRPATSP